MQLQGAIGEVYRAIRFHKEGLAIAQQISDRYSESWLLGYLADDYMDCKEFERAKDYYEKQLELSREIGDKCREAYALFHLGVISHYLNDYPQAVLLAHAALEIFDRIESSEAFEVQKKISEWQEQIR